MRERKSHQRLVDCDKSVPFPVHCVSILCDPSVDDMANIASSATRAAEMKPLKAKMRKQHWASVKPSAAHHTWLCPPSPNRKSRCSSLHTQGLSARPTIEHVCQCWSPLFQSETKVTLTGIIYFLIFTLNESCSKQLSRYQDHFFSSFKGVFRAAWIINEQWRPKPRDLIIRPPHRIYPKRVNAICF